MKNTLLLLSFALMSIFAFGQTPQAFKYQAVARDLNGNPVINQEISVKISILSGSPEGTVEYCELHQTTTNSLGLINLEVGRGTAVTGNFVMIAWGSNASFIKTEMDITGGGNFVFMGTSQLLSVPYSLFSDNGIRSMTTEERDALVSPFTGMQIYNSTSNCLNYFNGAAWFETCGQCTPMPTQADAGEDQYFADATLTTTLQGNNPEHGTGTWTIANGDGGSFANTNDPQTLFTGQLCESYSLKWTISTACGLTSDSVIISFDTSPTVADAGQDITITTEALSLNLAANTPELGIGQWTIFSGEGGTIANPTSPATLFTGQSCTEYVLVWEISSPCHSISDTVSVTFFTTPTTANAGEDQTIPQLTYTTLAANTPLIGQGHWMIIEGTGGQLVTPNSPNSIFLGQTNSLYILQWKISSICTTSNSDVQIIFGCPLPTTANAGPDQINYNVSNTILQGNPPAIGIGQWSIISGVGGILDIPESPTSSFTGQMGEIYELQWTISNSCDTTNDQMTIRFVSFSCGSNITIAHNVGNVAPISKTVTYGTVTNIPGEPSKCWITRNLGASQQATAVSDATEASAGWYWQFNRKQGYKHDGTVRTPNNTWITSIEESSDWIVENDPCSIELDAGWRIPTKTEWTNIDAGGNWTNWIGPWNSGLKIHAAGYLDSSDGSLLSRGSFGYYWNSTSRSAGYGWFLFIYSGACGMSDYGKSYGFSLRCLKEETSTSLLNLTPTIQDVDAASGTTTFEVASNSSWTVEENVSWLSVSPLSGGGNGTLTVTYEANTSSESRVGQITITAVGGNPVVNVTVTQAGAFQWSCGQPITDTRDGKNYNTLQIGNQCWMAENLNVGSFINGSSLQTNNEIIEKYCFENSQANCNVYGGLYQWNEMMSYATIEGEQGICMTGWHLPSDAEWTTLTTYLGGESVAGGKMKEAGTTHWNSPNTGATNSSGFTGLPGGLRLTNGTFDSIGDYGYWWPSTEFSSSNSWTRNLIYQYAFVNRYNDDKGYGFSVRCLMDD